MAIEGRRIIAMIDDDSIAIATDPFSLDDDTVKSRMDRRTVINADIHTGMENLTSINRMDPIAKRRRNDAMDRPDHGCFTVADKAFPAFEVLVNRFGERLGNTIL